MKKYFHDHDGFTLVELMIVVAVIAILAAIAIPSYLGIQKKAARSEAKANLEALALALEGYMAENNNYGPAGDYSYICGQGCSKTGFAGGFPAALATIANLGGGYNYNYWIHVVTSPLPSFVVAASALRGNVAGDISPSINSSGQKLPAVGFW